jgi:hypothetical protein
VARKLTAELLAAVAEATERGVSARAIAAAAGVSERTVVAARSQLREQGRLPAYAPPSSAWTAARAVASAVEEEPAPSPLADRLRSPEVKQALLGSVLRASHSGSWRASVWLLEKLHPDEFGTRVSAPPAEAPNGIDPETGEVSIAHLRVVK